MATIFDIPWILLLKGKYQLRQENRLFSLKTVCLDSDALPDGALPDGETLNFFSISKNEVNFEEESLEPTNLREHYIDKELSVQQQKRKICTCTASRTSLKKVHRFQNFFHRTSFIATAKLSNKPFIKDYQITVTVTG